MASIPGAGVQLSKAAQAAVNKFLPKGTKLNIIDVDPKDPPKKYPDTNKLNYAVLNSKLNGTFKMGKDLTGVTLTQKGHTGHQDVKGNNLDNLIFGNAASNKVTGAKGDDLIFGQGGSDKLMGNSGDDTLFGGNGHDSLSGGGGDDSISGDNGNDSITGGQGNDSIDGGNGKDSIFGDQGADSINAGAGNDEAHGGGGDDSIWGMSGDDKLFGDAGDDHLFGGKGNDTLYGGGGSNTLTGGSGSDKFVIGSNAKYDTITDFNAKHDKIDLSETGAKSMADLTVTSTKDGLLVEIKGGGKFLIEGDGNHWATDIKKFFIF